MVDLEPIVEWWGAALKDNDRALYVGLISLQHNMLVHFGQLIFLCLLLFTLRKTLNVF